MKVMKVICTERKSMTQSVEELVKNTYDPPKVSKEISQAKGGLFFTKTPRLCIRVEESLRIKGR